MHQIMPRQQPQRVPGGLAAALAVHAEARQLLRRELPRGIAGRRSNQLNYDAGCANNLANVLTVKPTRPTWIRSGFLEMYGAL